MRLIGRKPSKGKQQQAKAAELQRVPRHGDDEKKNGFFNSMTPRNVRRSRSQSDGKLLNASSSITTATMDKQQQQLRGEIITIAGGSGSGTALSPKGISPRKSTEWKSVTTELHRRMGVSTAANVKANAAHATNHHEDGNPSGALPPRFDISPAARHVLAKKDKMMRRGVAGVGTSPSMQSKSTRTTHDSSSWAGGGSASVASTDKQQNNNNNNNNKLSKNTRRGRAKASPSAGRGPSLSWTEQSLVEVAMPPKNKTPTRRKGGGGAAEAISVFEVENSSQKGDNTSAMVSGGPMTVSSANNNHHRSVSRQHHKKKATSTSSVVSEASATSRGTVTSRVKSVQKITPVTLTFLEKQQKSPLKRLPSPLKRTRAADTEAATAATATTNKATSHPSGSVVTTNARSVTTSRKAHSSLSTGPQEDTSLSPVGSLLPLKISKVGGGGANKSHNVVLSMDTVKRMLRDRMALSSNEYTGLASKVGGEITTDEQQQQQIVQATKTAVAAAAEESDSSSLCFWGCHAQPMDPEMISARAAGAKAVQHKMWLEVAKECIRKAKHGMATTAKEPKAKAKTLAIPIPTSPRLPEGVKVPEFALVDAHHSMEFGNDAGESSEDDEDDIRSISSVDLLVKWIGNCGEPPDLRDHFPVPVGQATEARKLALHEAARTPRGYDDEKHKKPSRRQKRRKERTK